MRGTRTINIIVVCIVFAVQCLQALSQENANSLLGRVERTYKSLDTYQLEGSISTQVRSAAGEINLDASFVMAAIKPDRLRFDIRNPAMGLEYLSIASGTTTWEYLSKQRQYTRKESKETFVDKELYFRMWALALGVMLPSFDQITQRLKNAKIVREESIELNGSKNCYVIEAEYGSPDYRVGRESSHKTFWIDKDRYAVLKEITKVTIKAGGLDSAETTYVTTFAVTKLNEPLEGKLFIFTPPDGAREVKQLKRQRGTKP